MAQKETTPRDVATPEGETLAHDTWTHVFQLAYSRRHVLRAALFCSWERAHCPGVARCGSAECRAGCERGSICPEVSFTTINGACGQVAREGSAVLTPTEVGHAAKNGRRCASFGLH